MKTYNQHYPRWMGNHPLDGMPWKKSWDAELARSVRDSMTISAIAERQGRTPGAIVERLKKTEPLFLAYWTARCKETGAPHAMNFHQDLDFLFDTTSEQSRWVDSYNERQRKAKAAHRVSNRNRREVAQVADADDEVVTLTIEGKELMDAIEARRLADQKKEDEALAAIFEQKKWVKGEIKRCMEKTINAVNMRLYLCLGIVIAVSIVTLISN